MARLVTYECDECGCEVTVREMPQTQLGPIYCCGAEMETVEAKPKKKTAKKKPAKKKKPAAKKKTKKKPR